MISPVLITLSFASFAEAIESKKQTFLQPLSSYPSLKEESRGGGDLANSNDSGTSDNSIFLFKTCSVPKLDRTEEERKVICSAKKNDGCEWNHDTAECTDMKCEGKSRDTCPNSQQRIQHPSNPQLVSLVDCEWIPKPVSACAIKACVRVQKIGGSQWCRIHRSPGNPSPSLEFTSDAFGKLAVYRTPPTEQPQDTMDNIMVGPNDLFGTIRDAYKSSWTVAIDQGVPMFTRHDFEAASQKGEKKKMKPEYELEIQATWISGLVKGNDNLLRAYNHNYDPAGSLFGEPGALAIKDVQKTLKFGTLMNAAKAMDVDTSEYNMEFVKINESNAQKFNIPTDEGEDMELTTYFYGRRYGRDTAVNLAGNFLEYHNFQHVMLPTTKESRLVVIGARVVKPETEVGPKKRKSGSLDGDVTLKLMAVEVPYGYAMLCPAGCIHGDMNSQGTIMVTLSTDSTRLDSADVVYMKSEETKESLHVHLPGYGDLDGSPIVHPPRIDPLVENVVLQGGEIFQTEANVHTKIKDAHFNFPDPRE